MNARRGPDEEDILEEDQLYLPQTAPRFGPKGIAGCLLVGLLFLIVLATAGTLVFRALQALLG